MKRWFAVIAGIVFGIGMSFAFRMPMQHGADRDYRGASYFRKEAAVIASELRKYKAKNGHYPTNDEGLLPITNAVGNRMDDSHAGHPVRIVPSGILAWWGDPLIYENRQGRSQRDFLWSPVNNDPDREYSWRVDNNIYVWSVGAKTAAPRLQSRAKKLYAILIPTVLLFVALIFIYVSSGMKNVANSAWYHKILYAVESTVWGVIVAMVVAAPFVNFAYGLGCGCRGTQITRTPELTKAYLQEMRKYESHGVISKNTLDKIIVNLQKDTKARAYHRY